MNNNNNNNNIYYNCYCYFILWSTVGEYSIKTNWVYLYIILLCSDNYYFMIIINCYHVIINIIFNY